MHENGILRNMSYDTTILVTNAVSMKYPYDTVLTHIRQRAHVHKRAWMMHHRHYFHQQMLMLFLFLTRTFWSLTDVEVGEGVDYKRRAVQMVGMRDNADEMILEEQVALL
jgi:hypothetical protein